MPALRGRATTEKLLDSISTIIVVGKYRLGEIPPGLLFYPSNGSAFPSAEGAQANSTKMTGRRVNLPDRELCPEN
jgi:hypothetical protein